MNENMYRLAKLVLLAVLGAGTLFVANRWAENGRYVQYDYGKEFAPGGEHLVTHVVFDTRTGQKIKR